MVNTNKIKKGYILYEDGEYRKNITVKVALTKNELKDYKKMAKQKSSRSLKEQLQMACNDMLGNLWEDFGEDDN